MPASAPVTEYTWSIANLDRETSDGYCFTVHYTVAAADGTYSSSAYGSLGLERPEGDMIPFAELTPDIVIGWVKDKFGEEKVTEIEVALQAQLDQQRQPTKSAGMPWQ